MKRGRKNYQTIPAVPPVDIAIDVGGGGGCSGILAIFSYIFVVLFFPFSLFYSIKVSYSVHALISVFVNAPILG